MTKVHLEYIVDENKHPKAVVIPVEEWRHILEEIEELEDIRAYDEAKADNNDEIIPFSQAVSEIKKTKNEI